jgi:xanthine/CO dehydrogenase XdhC/CoxF family maturation factor
MNDNVIKGPSSLQPSRAAAEFNSLIFSITVSPLGLDICADSPGEIAVTVIAKILTDLRKHTGTHLCRGASAKWFSVATAAQACSMFLQKIIRATKAIASNSKVDPPSGTAAKVSAVKKW